MKFSLKSYNDLGKCAMATLLEEFDTEKHHIYLCYNNDSIFTCKNIKDSFVEVKIESVEDLFPFLWGLPTISTGDNFFFYSASTWWALYFKDIINRYKNNIEKTQKKLKGKNLSDTRKEKLEKELSYSQEELKYSIDRIERLNEEKSEIEKTLIDENRK